MPKKTPVRICIGCGENKPKKELFRIVRLQDGQIVADLTGKQSGRGAYLCRNSDCLLLAKKQRRLERSFSCRITPECYAQIEEMMQHVLSGTTESTESA